MRKEQGNDVQNPALDNPEGARIDDAELQKLEQYVKGPLGAYGARQPGEEDTQRLIALLQPEFDQLKEQLEAGELPLHDLSLGRKPSLTHYWLRMAGTMGRAFWLANAAVFIMLTLISSVQPMDNMGSLFSGLMPLFMMACIGYSYRTWNRQMREVESITPFPPALQMLSRLLLAVAVNLAFGLAASLYLAAVVKNFAVLPFLLHWLSQMMLVGGVLAAVLFHKGMKLGFAAGILVWFALQSSWWPERLLQDLPSQAVVYGVQLAVIGAGLLLFLAAYRKCTDIRWVERS